MTDAGRLDHHPHHLASTTHTVEMAQIADVNERLVNRRPDTVTATDLGLAGAASASAAVAGLRGDAVLVELRWDGSPEYPYIYGHFAPRGGAAGGDTVTLHTRALRELSHRLGAHHLWGLGSAPEPVPG